MRKYEDKEHFIKSMKQLIQDDFNHLSDCVKIFNILENKGLPHIITKEYFTLERMCTFSKRKNIFPKRTYKMVQNQQVNISIFEKVINDEILDFLNDFYFDIDIEPYEYEIFLITVHHIKYFNKSGLDTHKSKYDRGIKQLKKRADELQYYSKETIEIILPMLPQVSLAHFIHLSSSEMNKDVQKYFYRYFYSNINKRYPKEDTLEFTYNEATKNYRNNKYTNIWEEYFKYKAKKI